MNAIYAMVLLGFANLFLVIGRQRQRRWALFLFTTIAVLLLFPAILLGLSVLL